MKKPCRFPVKKWKDIPKETQERIRRELAVPLPPHLKLYPPPLRLKERKRKPRKFLILLLSILLFSLFLVFLLLFNK